MDPLRRFPTQAIFGGVCAGLAYRFKTPLWCVRMLMCFATVLAAVLMRPYWPLAIAPYVLFWIFVPPAREPADFEMRTCEQDDFI